MILAFKLLLYIGIFVFRGSWAVMNDEAKLLSHLFRNYSAQARPVTHFTTAVVVKLGLEMSHIVSVKERDQQVTYSIWLRMSWTNELMKWNATLWGGINEAYVSPNLVWIPDLVIYNEVNEKVYEGTTKYKMRIQIESNGRHSWYLPVILVGSCKINVRLFPFDRQKCQLKFGSWFYHKTKLVLVEDERPIITPRYIESSEWLLEKATREVKINKYACCDNPFVDMIFMFDLKRKPLYHVYTAICPCVILVIIILFSFLLPSDCMERLGTIVTMILAIVVFLQLVSDILPRNSDSTSALSVFYLALMVESTASLIATCIVIFISRKGSDKRAKPLPSWMRKSILQIPEKASQLANRISTVRRKNVYDVDGQNTRESDCKQRNKVDVIPDDKLENDIRNEQEEIEYEWQLLASILDRTFFIIFVFVYGITIWLLFAA